MDYFQKNYGEIDAEGEKEFDDDALKEENFYRYHDNVSPYDPKGVPYSYFYVTVMGQVEFGEFLELDGLQLKYNFVAGEDWY